MSGCGSSLFGNNNSQYIKINGGDFVAIQGPNTVERLITSDLRIPYKQILKSRVVIKAGSDPYLLNFLGLGDNATFLAIKATYDVKSVYEEDNYLSYSYFDDMSKKYYFDQLLVLTGNSTHRIKQIYIGNENINYSVSLDVMVGVIDDTYSYFGNTIVQTGTIFYGLEYTDIKTHVVGETIVVNDKNDPPLPLIYLELSDINSLEVSGRLLTIDDSSFGTVLLLFLTEYDANQAHSLINYVLRDPLANINDLNPVADSADPIVYFYDRVGASASGDWISLNGATAGVPYNSGQGYTFSTSMSLTTWGVTGSIDKTRLIELLIYNVIDNRDGIIDIQPQNIIIESYTSSSIDYINTIGTYSVIFDYNDIAGNQLDGINIEINVSS